MFSGGTERDQWHEIGYLAKVNPKICSNRIYAQYLYLRISSMKFIFTSKDNNFSNDPCETVFYQNVI